MSTFSKAGIGRFASLALSSGLVMSVQLANVSGALAQGDRLPPPPLPGAADPVGGSAPAPGSASAPAGLAPVNAADLTVVPGAGEDRRRALLGRIMEAKSQGVGITTYKMAFDALEDSAKAGATEEAVSKRVDSLNSSLDDQLKRSAILKTQRAAPPVAASEPSAPFGGNNVLGAGGPPPGVGNTDTAALIQKLQSKFGGQIPDAYKDKIPAGLGGASTADLLKNPQVMDLLKSMKK